MVRDEARKKTEVTKKNFSIICASNLAIEYNFERLKHAKRKMNMTDRTFVLILLVFLMFFFSYSLNYSPRTRLVAHSRADKSKISSNRKLMKEKCQADIVDQSKKEINFSFH